MENMPFISFKLDKKPGHGRVKALLDYLDKNIPITSKNIEKTEPYHVNDIKNDIINNINK